jgi:hypothetical protein
MENGPDILALLARLQEMDPIALAGLLQNPAGAPAGDPAANPAHPAAGLPPAAPIGVPTPPRTLLEKFTSPVSDPLLPHYATLLPPFNRVRTGNEEERFDDVLSFATEERPILLVGVMRDNVPELVPLWGPSRHLDPPYARSAAHDVPVCFCWDVVSGNLPASAVFDCDWLVTEPLELLRANVFASKLAVSAVGASSIPELDADDTEDLYVAQAVILPGCLLPDLLRLPRNPVVAWRLLRARAAELNLLDSCTGLWNLLRALASPNHREESCVTLALIDGNASFVGHRRAILEATLPALGAITAPSSPLIRDPIGTANLADASAVATRPAAAKIITIEEKWPHSYSRLLLLSGAPDVDALDPFWHEYADQKKAQRWAFVQSASAALASSLGLSAPTIVAKMIEVLDSLVFAGASEDSLNEGLTIWQFPALAPADTDSVNESLRSWEGLLTGNMAMSLSDVKEILRVGKIGAPKNWLHSCAQIEHWTVMMALLLGTGHKSVAWLLSLARLARSKALVFDRQTASDPKLLLAVLSRIHLTFHAFFESVQTGGSVLLPDLSSVIRQLRERRLSCPRLPPAMQSWLSRCLLAHA